MTEQFLPCVEHTLGDHPTHSIIWLHGLGADGHDFFPMTSELELPEGQSVRFVFPHAPMLPITVNNGYVMRAWYDIITLSDVHRTVDADGIAKSCAQIHALIDREVERGIPAENILLAGFSQGGVMAYYAGLSSKHSLSGIVALSTYLPNATELDKQRQAANFDTPIFAGHGTYDPVIRIQLGEEALQQVQDWGYPVEWHEYPTPHSVCAEEIEDLSDWLINLWQTK
ncbi:carboxylesterase [Leeia sp. TBRC 13508]|uniref:Carboxylesterase n=1 Tax=Leeia speluncae TaxID=2884804 RepID=A0ABS8D8Q0_9NEIS|nr:carboxylesterase [Leeia speluncae]MCB6184393.1 carboxylesterase [Leeia speluncae]